MARTLTLPTHSSTDDPLTLALLPPPDETPVEKAARLQREALAKQKSDAIDHEIEKEKKKRRAEGRSGGKGGGRCVKVLLLGQSESGKSTTLKNFQLTYAPQAWSAEKLAWRAVIFLNLVRAINTICDAVRREIEFSNVRQRGVGSSGSLNLSLSRGIDEEEEPELDVEDALSDASPSTSPPHSPIIPPTASTSLPALSEPASSPFHVSLPSLSTPPHPLTTHHSDLVTRLESLKVVQKELERRLGAGSGEDCGAFGPPEVSTVEGGGGDPEKEDYGFGAYPPAKPHRPQEFFVRSTGWKKLALAHARGAYASFKPRLSTSSRWGTSNRHHDEHAASVVESRADSDTDWIEDVVREVVKRREVMKTVWADRAVREVVRKRKVGVGEAGEL